MNLFFRHIKYYHLILVIGCWLMTTDTDAQAIELDTMYTDSFCVAIPKPLPSDTINWQEERDSCIAGLKAIAIENAQTAWRDSIARLIAGEIKKQKCFGATFNETMTATYQTTEHHYTLYYYDQAGNLVQTIPPAGVVPLVVEDPAFVDGVWNGVTEPPHLPIHITRYEYNGANQMISSITPDAGSKDYILDRVQRVRFTQNAEQVADNDYAYTKFDRQGRVIETGELDNQTPTAAEVNSPDFPGVLETREEVVSTSYDDLDSPGIPTDNSRGRIVKIQNNQMESFYDYDAHGNVRELTHTIYDMLDDAISLQYDYDLISGNVNEFRYEPGELDQLTQRFGYDADNRLISAYSSDDGHVFEEDARYFYYLHGPLARVEIGEDKLQGLDYLYTLQGWIKSVNIPASGGPSQDPGLDGLVDETIHLNKYFVNDTMKYALGYNYADYLPVGGISLMGSGIENSFPAMDSEILGEIGEKGLFNGNIALMMTHNSVGNNGMAYQYDALHRIKFTTNFDWNPGWGTTGDFTMPVINYDPNGNLKRMHTTGPSGFDDITYQYYDDIMFGRVFPNRLRKVSGTTTLSDMLPQTEDDNYQYDAIGNLIRDKSEDTDMAWDVYGKLRSVSGSSIPYGFNDYAYDPMGNRLSKSHFPEREVYVRDAQGNLIALYHYIGDRGVFSETIKEFNIYGSSRIGIIHADRIIDSSNPETIDPVSSISGRGIKSYELSNHLGNVLTILDDVKYAWDNNNDDLFDQYVMSPKGSADYYPFGLEMEGFTSNSENHRFGFNGKEKDPSMGSLTHYDYGFRIYNPAIGRFLSVDPLTADYPSWSPYPFAMNRPIDGIDLDGLEWVRAEDGSTSEVQNNYIENPYNDATRLIYDQQQQLIKDGYVPSPGNDINVEASRLKRSPISSSELYGSGYLSQRGEGLYYNDNGINNRMYLFDPDMNDWRQVYDQFEAESGRLQAASALVDNLSWLFATGVSFGFEGLALSGAIKAGTSMVAVKGITRSLDDLSSLRGMTWEEAESVIPTGWTRGPLNKGEGIKFVNPTKKGEQILMEKGWLGAKDPLHGGPYMKISRNGTVERIPLQGNPTLN